MAIRRRGLAQTVVGVGKPEDDLQTAVRLGAIDTAGQTGREAVRDADLVVLALPLSSYEPQLRDWAQALAVDAVVTDVGSVKGALVDMVEALLPNPASFVGGHPIAGREKSGVAAGAPDLFDGARCVLTPTPRTDAAALRKIQRLWEALGSFVSLMDPYEHDRIFGAVSHLPHMVAYTLMQTLRTLQQERGAGDDLLQFGGGSLRDTTRIAASSPELWRDVCLWNRENLLTVIEAYGRHLGALRDLIAARDAGALYSLFEVATRTREQLGVSSERHRAKDVSR